MTMSVPWGVTDAGFVRPTVRDLIAAFEADELADMSADLDVSSDQPIGQLNGIYGNHLAYAWENLELLYNQLDPDAAEGRLLEMLAKLTGTFRRGSTPSEVMQTCNLDAGTTLIAGTHFAAIENKPDIRWTPVSDFTAPSTGFHQVAFQCELLGPTEGLAGTINVIATPLVGWNSVVNPNDAELGKEIDDDPALRARRERELATMGSATVRAITANLAQAFVDKLQNLTVFENDDDIVDANGLPPHSVEALIFDGEVPSIANNDIAQVIYDSKASGIKAYGQTTGLARALVNGVEALKPVGFSRATQLPVYVTIDLVRGAGYIGDDAVAVAVAKAANARFGPGKAVVEAILMGFVTALGGVEDVPLVRLGLAPSPAGTANIPVTIREIARFDTSRIVVNAT
jgi:uncharacterized phage protein gp47/JayE